MPSANRLKCAECVRVGRPCVNLSWESLDKTRVEYEKKVEEDEKLLADVIARLLRNKKILAQAKDRAAKKAECLANELEGEGEDVRAEEINCPAAGCSRSGGTSPLFGLLVRSVHPSADDMQ